MKFLILSVLMCFSAHAYNIEKSDGEMCRWLVDRVTYNIDAPSAFKLKIKRGAEYAAKTWTQVLTYNLQISGVVSNNADIQITYAYIDGPYAAYTTIRSDIWGKILSATIVINEAYASTTWSQNMWNGLLLHEFGHAVGMDHNYGISVMNPSLWPWLRWPMQDDIKGVRWLYGLDRPNTPLGPWYAGF